MKIIIFIIGLVLSTWVGLTVHSAAEPFVEGVKKSYIETRAIQSTLPEKSGEIINKALDSYTFIWRVLGKDVAEKTARKELLSNDKSILDRIDNLFTYDLAFWVSFGCAILTFSLYINIVGIIMFILKPITFFIK